MFDPKSNILLQKMVTLFLQLHFWKLQKTMLFTFSQSISCLAPPVTKDLKTIKSQISTKDI